MKLPHALQIYLTVFVKNCMRMHFFKVVQQQTIGEVGNSIVCGQIISVCNSERIIKTGQYFRKLCVVIGCTVCFFGKKANEKGSSFLDSQCIYIYSIQEENVL